MSDWPLAALHAWADVSPQAVDGEPPENLQPVSHSWRKANEMADASCAFGHRRCGSAGWGTVPSISGHTGLERYSRYKHFQHHPFCHIMLCPDHKVSSPRTTEQFVLSLGDGDEAGGKAEIQTRTIHSKGCLSFLRSGGNVSFP